MKKILEQLSQKDKMEIKSMAIDMIREGRHDNPIDCWVHSVLIYLNKKTLLKKEKNA